MWFSNSTRLLLLILILGGINLWVQGQTSPSFRTEARVDWKIQTLTLQVESPVPRAIANPPTAANLALRQIQQALPELFSRSIVNFQVDSKNVLQEWIHASVENASRLILTAAKGNPGLPRLSPSLTKVTTQYQYPLFPTIAELFIRHRQPMAVPRILQWVPTAEFSGIVIYARGELPHWGENRNASLQPALFPEIYMEPTDPLLLMPMADPQYLQRWGMVAYTESFDEKAFLHRIGETPLRVFAVGVFGKYPTDIILAREDGYRILSRAENRQLLAEGRILVIVDSVTESLYPF